MATVANLEALFVEEIKDVYNAEQQILKALPKLIKAAKSPELGAALKEHLAATKVHAERIQQIMKAYGAKGGKHCMGMEGLLKEGAEVLETEMPPEVRDAAIISAAQRVEHYEMAAYGCLRTFAKVLGDVPSAQILQTTLDEEADADRKLTQLAEFSINPRALKAGGAGNAAKADAKGETKTAPAQGAQKEAKPAAKKPAAAKKAAA